MEKLEYIESKLSELTPEFKSSIIVGEDNREYTFENYLRGYVYRTSMKRSRIIRNNGEN